jgi:predicted nucleic acid-binding protein
VSLIVLDTDVASTILRGRQTDRLQAKLAGHNWLITFVTLGELTHWTIARSWGPRKAGRPSTVAPGRGAPAGG